jgi:hypothetical protein
MEPQVVPTLASLTSGSDVTDVWNGFCREEWQLLAQPLRCWRLVSVLSSSAGTDPRRRVLRIVMMEENERGQRSDVNGRDSNR